jgi:hypothetical protein
MIIIINKKVCILSVLITYSYQSTPRRVIQDSTLHQLRCEILKSYNAKGILSFMFMAYLTTVSAAHIEQGREKVTLENDNKLAGTYVTPLKNKTIKQTCSGERMRILDTWGCLPLELYYIIRGVYTFFRTETE